MMGDLTLRQTQANIAMTQSAAPASNSASKPAPISGYRHLLLATDFSPHATYAAHRAAELARLYAARLSLVNTLEPPVVMDEFYDSMATIDMELERTLEQRARERLEALRKDIAAPEATVEVLFGRPKIEILRYAQDHQVDLIVLGSHGHHGLARLLGSTTDSVNHDAACDVLAVRLPAPDPA